MTRLSDPYDKVYVYITKHITICMLIDPETLEVVAKGIGLCSLSEKPYRDEGRKWALERAEETLTGEELEWTKNNLHSDNAQKVFRHLRNCTPPKGKTHILSPREISTFYQKADNEPLTFIPRELSAYAKYCQKKAEGTWENR